MIPENYTAPGKKPTRSSTIATGEQVRPLEAHSFYSHDNIMFNALKMASDNSVQLKKKFYQSYSMQSIKRKLL